MGDFMSNSNIGKMIAKKRSLAGLSLKELSKRCGFSDSELMKIENGTRKNPNWSCLCELAKALETHPFEFLLAAGYISEEDISYSNKFHHLNLLNDENTRNVQRFVDFLVTEQEREKRDVGVKGGVTGV